MHESNISKGMYRPTKHGSLIVELVGMLVHKLGKAINTDVASNIDGNRDGAISYVYSFKNRSDIFLRNRCLS
jgi:hypothetical protein